MLDVSELCCCALQTLRLCSLSHSGVNRVTLRVCKGSGRCVNRVSGSGHSQEQLSLLSDNIRVIQGGKGPFAIRLCL